MRARLVLVHGSRASAAQWARYPALLPGIEAVPVDLPGHGGRLGQPFTTAAAVEVIADAVAATPAGRPVVLAGHSLGGYMAMAYAEAGHRSLAGLALIGASADPEGAGAAVYRSFGALIPRVGSSRMAAVSNRVGRLLGVREGLPDGSAYGAIPAAFEAVIRDCRSTMLAAVSCPVLILNGQFDQMRLHWRRYRDAAPDARVAVVPGASHFAPFSHPHYVAATLRRFIADVTQPSS